MTDTDTDTTFTPGQRVWFQWDTWAGRVRYQAEVLKVTPKRIGIRLLRKDGKTATRYVLPDSLESRQDDE